MSKHSAKIIWQNNSDSFPQNNYSRAHTWHFDGGLSVPASASPTIVPPPFSDEKAVDPEEAFIAALSSCHMLWFLSLAAKKGFNVLKYVDQAEGVLQKNESGKMAFTNVILQPRVTFEQNKFPAEAEFEELHHLAHSACFLANSVKTEIILKPELVQEIP